MNTLNRLSDKQRDLAGHPNAVNMAIGMSRKFAKQYPSLTHDYESAALYALCRAAFHYDPARNDSFTAFAYPRVRGELADVTRDAFKRRRIGFVVFKGLDSIEDEQSPLCPSDPPDWAARYEEAAIEAVRMMDGRNREIIYSHLMRCDCVQAKEAGKRHGLKPCQSRVILKAFRESFREWSVSVPA